MSASRHAVVTGAAGFIGSNLVDRLLADGWRVTGYDNLSTGLTEFLVPARDKAGFTFVEGDLLDRATLERAVAGADMVFHLAANADVRHGTERPERDLEQNTIGTFNVLEAMRKGGVKRIAFSSTGSIYGEHHVVPTPEDAPFPIQTSLYGASKLAGEGLIQAYCEGFGMSAVIFRFVSVLGERYTHGHVFDFCRKLFVDPTTLPVLGNGKQRKSYMYVADCVAAVLLAAESSADKVGIFNLGIDGSIEVRQSIGWIADELVVTPELVFAGGERGWIGDSPLIQLDTARITRLGWVPQVSIEDGVRRTVRWLSANRWVFDRRD
ncbi:MAG: SDR family NAD(P)-dependent oxidoreductase [Aliidongia sp.]